MLEVNELTAGYRRGVAVVHGVSVTVAPGEVVGILGPNGAGKTSLLSAIVGTITRRSGTVGVDGTPMKPGDPRGTLAAGVAYVPEGRRLFGKLTVEENLLIGRQSAGRGGGTAALGPVYDLFPRLRERRHQQARTLSGGEAQMVALGRALSTEPRYILLDEPSFGLAPRVVEQLSTVISELSASAGVLVVEQNAGIAMDVCSRVLTMSSGEVTGSVDPADPDMRESLIEAYFR